MKAISAGSSVLCKEQDGRQRCNTLLIFTLLTAQSSPVSIFWLALSSFSDYLLCEWLAHM